MRSPLRRLRFFALVVAVTLLGAACGNQNSALRSEGRASATTTEPPSSSPEPSGGSLPALATTTSISRPVVTPSLPTTVPGGSGSGVKGSVVIGPVCPVERIPPDPQCAPRPGPADIQLVRPEGGVAAQARAGADGQFTVVVGPGRYGVEASAPAPSPGRGCQAEPAQVTVAAGSFTSVVVTCDTGIR